MTTIQPDFRDFCLSPMGACPVRDRMCFRSTFVIRQSFSNGALANSSAKADEFKLDILQIEHYYL